MNLELSLASECHSLATEDTQGDIVGQRRLVITKLSMPRALELASNAAWHWPARPCIGQ